MSTPRTLPSYPASPNGWFTFNQPRIKRDDGHEEILPWIYYGNGEDIESNTQYLLLPYTEGWPCWDENFTHFCFRARRYPKGTFPIDADSLDSIESYEVYVVMNRACKVVKEYRLFTAPKKVSWDDTEEGLVFDFDATRDREARRKYALKEYEAAKAVIGGGPIDEDSPVHDRKRLENYLYFYKQEKCGPDPFKYAVRLRNRYLREITDSMHLYEVLYDENILDGE